MKDPRHIYLEKENQGRGITLLVVSGGQITPKILHKMQIDSE